MENKEIKAQMYNFQQWVGETNAQMLKESMDLLLAVSGYKVLNFVEHHFPNGGYTCLWLLAESHLAVHTFVSDKKSYIELSGCNREMNKVFQSEFFKVFKSVEVYERV